MNIPRRRRKQSGKRAIKMHQLLATRGTEPRANHKKLTEQVYLTYSYKITWINLYEPKA